MFVEHSRKIMKLGLLLATSAFAMAVATPAVAQDAQSEDDQQRVLGPVKVTTQKREESIQDVPIAVSAFDENTLDKLQLAGGPDLVKTIPNVAFTKSNFTAYNFKIRGIGADAIAQSGDAGVGVHLNDVPLTGNRLFEAEFYDVERVETLRGPQGTLYGRNATAGVINVITNKPVLRLDKGSFRGTFGTDSTFKLKSMVNIPIGDSIALRVAGSYLKRDGFAENLVTGNKIDDRDLYSIRATLGFEPTRRVRGWIMFENFEESDSRIRSGKQLCKKEEVKRTFGGVTVHPVAQLVTTLGCKEAPLKDSNDRVNSIGTLNGGVAILAGLLNGDAFTDPLNPNLREIESAFDPQYDATMSVYATRLEYDITESLSLIYSGSYSESNVVSREDYNKISPTVRFNTDAGAFLNPALRGLYPVLFPGGTVNDPQLGRSNVFLTYDVSGGSSEQFSQELRFQSNFDGWLNFNAGLILINYEAVKSDNKDDGYYVLSNPLSAFSQIHNALATNPAAPGAAGIFSCPVVITRNSSDVVTERTPGRVSCSIDTNTENPVNRYAPVVVDDAGNGQAYTEGTIKGDGANYFRSISPYELDSFAMFGELYVDVANEFQLTVGIRYTDDQKRQDIFPTILFSPGNVFRKSEEVDVDYQEFTGRIGVDWKPNWSPTDDTLIYAFYSKGYKGGGINPPQPEGTNLFPKTFDPEFVNSYEIGTKNTFQSGALQFNATGFYYDYEGYQMTQIVNRSSANFNVDADIKGLEFETVWNPADTFIINANLGILDATIKDTMAIDVLDRTNGNDDYVAIKSQVTFSNCIVSAAGFRAILLGINQGAIPSSSAGGLCNGAVTDNPSIRFGAFADNPSTRQTNEEANFIALLNPLVTGAGYTALKAGDFTPSEGFAKDLDGNAIPNAPELTWNLGMEYTWESAFGYGFLTGWGLTSRIDYYYQGSSFSRVWNTPRDYMESWENINVTIRFEDVASGMTVEIFGKNVANEDVITGAYLTDDATGLFTNIFLTEPATFGVSISKSW